ncbi:helix-turn-helix domain-containing protein [Paenibacillus septentrionalis]|uniref:Helix-turn-helix domain-containing protein n=1 Tax=Paenibacillus septentrionalis TaxID=429342 RepID=A0ABW1V4T8_9BACL
MLKAFLAEMRQNRLLLPEMLSIYEEQMALLRQRLRSNALHIDQANERKHPIDLHHYNSYEAIEHQLLEELHDLLEAVGNQSVNKSYWIVEKAMKYIAEHYSEDMKASEVAEWLNITPNHFSYIFKQNTGKNFKEYMNDVRIGHAQRLLATTNDKVFEIADRVGYKEYKYFVSVFKSVTGMTPKEYRAIKASI